MNSLALTGREPVDSRAFLDTLGHYASGIAVITGFQHSEPVGFTCQSFYSVSMTPPLISFSVMLNSSSYPRIRASGRFAVNVLSCDQHGVSKQFASKGVDKWRGIDWSLSGNGNPVIADTLMWLDCDIETEHEAGDHWIVIGRVRSMSPPDWHSGEPLLYFKGRYRQLQSLED